MQESLSQIEKNLFEEYDVLRGELSEKGRRKWAGFQAQRLGYGGQTLVHRAIGLDYKTIKRGIREIEEGESLESGRVRQSGGGRKCLMTLYPNLSQDLERLLEDSTRGDPENPLKWTSKSTLKLCQALKEKGYQISQRSVCTLLEALGYSLQANRKTREFGNHPERDAQFALINNKVKEFQKAKQPVISVDTKKKELIGNYKNAGREYHPKGQPRFVNVYDFLDQEKGKVAPYGVYDLDKNKGWVSVGVSSDTAEFAVNSIRSWWSELGQETYKNATCLYINADGGGSNGSRNRLGKKELQQFANETNLSIHVSHFPPGTSKWNKIEHRLFSFISANWRGKPLIDKATVVSLIANTTTKTGLKIKAKLDERNYQTGIKVSDQEMNMLNLHKDTFHGEWNYFIQPN